MDLPDPCLDENARMAVNLATIASHQECAQPSARRSLRIGAKFNRSRAQPPRIDALDEEVVETDFPVFIDNDSAIPHGVVAQHAMSSVVCRCRKAGDQRYRQPLG